MAYDGLAVYRGGMSRDSHVDQVVRLEEFRKEHPDIEVSYRVSYWEAVTKQENGETIITRYELGDLLDKLEADA
jgi:hypothetical protein